MQLVTYNSYMGALQSSHCARGHKLAGGNLYQRKNGQRECRTCSAIRISAWRRKQKTGTAQDARPSAMDKSIRVYPSFDAMKHDEYREWQEMLPYERLNAAAELSLAAYAWKESPRNVPARLQRTLIHFQKAQD